MLQIESISKSFKKRLVLDKLKLPNISNQKLVSFIGKNGAGKSTYLKELIRLIGKKRKVGQINNNVLKYQDIGYLPQDYRIHATITVLELLITTINIDTKSLVSKKGSLEMAMNALKEIEIIHLANKLCTELSGGESQLVGLAQAIVNNPNLLILDEPTSALDLKNQMILMNNVRNHIKEHNIFGIMVMHDINLAMQFSDYIAVLQDGKLFAFGQPFEIINEQLIWDVFEVKSKIIRSEADPILAISSKQ